VITKAHKISSFESMALDHRVSNSQISEKPYSFNGVAIPEDLSTKRLHPLPFVPGFDYCIFGGTSEGGLAERIPRREKA
jgi:hypothetical protein